MNTFAEIMACSSSNVNYFDKLGELISKGRIVPFVGAGMSIPFYPSWKEVLLKMISGYRASSKVEGLLHNNKYEEAATLVRTELGDIAFDRMFAGEFAPDKIINATFRESQKLLPLLFDGMMVTTNYDKVLETVYSHQKADFTYVLTPSTHSFPKYIAETGIRENNHFLLKLHGDVSDGYSRVLTEEEYERIYGVLKKSKDEHKSVSYEEGSYLEMLAYMLMHSSFLFLGCSLLSDRPLELLQLQTNKSSPHNFAFLEMPDISNEEKQLAFDKRRKELADQSILAIWYPTGKHEESLSILFQELLKRKHDYNSQGKIQIISAQNAPQLVSLTDTVDIINIAFNARLTVENIQQIVQLSRKIDIHNTDHVMLYAEDARWKVREYIGLLESELSSLIENDVNQTREVLYKTVKSFLRNYRFPIAISQKLWVRSMGENNETFDDSSLQAWSVKLLKATGMVGFCEKRLQRSNNEIVMYMIALQLAVKRENDQTRLETLSPNESAVRKRLDLLHNEKAKLADTIRKYENLSNVIMGTAICVEQEIKQVQLLKTMSSSKQKTNERLMKNYVDAYNDTNKQLEQLTALIGEN